MVANMKSAVDRSTMYVVSTGSKRVASGVVGPAVNAHESDRQTLDTTISMMEKKAINLGSKRVRIILELLVIQ